jgi:hypothetical protein
MFPLNPTPPEKLCDSDGRPYFLWDSDMSLDAFRSLLEHGDPDVRAHAVGKLLRQARTDDALTFVTPEGVARDWFRIRRHLGRRREFWEWLLPKLVGHDLDS